MSTRVPVGEGVRVSPADFSALLRSAASFQLSTRGMTLTPQCEHELEAFIDQGVRNFFASEGEDFPGVEHTLRRFVLAMIEAGERQGESVLSESVFFEIRSFFCPGTWPFC